MTIPRAPLGELRDLSFLISAYYISLLVILVCSLIVSSHILTHRISGEYPFFQFSTVKATSLDRVYKSWTGGSLFELNIPHTQVVFQYIATFFPSKDFKRIYLRTSWWSSGPDFAFQCRASCSIPGWGGKIPHTSWPKNKYKTEAVL